jgi:hypothetical protein
MSNIPTQVQYWIDQLEIDQAEHIKDDYKNRFKNSFPTVSELLQTMC